MTSAELVSREELCLRPLPCWAELSAERRRERIDDLLRSIEEATARRALETGRKPLGRTVLLRQNPHQRPNLIKKAPAPLIHAASGQGCSALRDRYRAFETAFHRAAERLRASILDIEFPTGSFPPSLPFVRALESG